MAKFLISFLMSFKSFPDNDAQFHAKPEGSQEIEEQVYVLFKTHPDRKNVCNITYSLPGLGGPIEKKISIACWSPMLKVYGIKEECNFRTEVNGNKTWAAFSVKQSMDGIKPDQLKTIIAKSLEFHFNEGPRHVARFKTEQWETYMYYNKFKQNRFIPVYSLREKIKVATKHKSNVATHSVRKKGTVMGNKSKLVTAKSRPKLIYSDTSNEPEICKTVASLHLYKISKSIMKSKQEPLTQKTSSPCSLSLPVSMLLYDKPVWVLRCERPMSRTIQDIFVFVTVSSLLDEETKQMFNPFSINLQSLEYIPVNELKALGINRFFVEYELDPIIPKTRTNLQQLRPNCIDRFKDIKVFLTDEFSPLSIISSIQSRKLLVRVIGVRDNLPWAKSGKGIGVYGANLKDDRMSSCIKAPTTNELLEMARNPDEPKPIVKRTNKRLSFNFRSGKNRTKKRNRLEGEDEQLTFPKKAFHFLIGIARFDLSPLVFGINTVSAYEALSSRPVIINDSKTPDFEHTCITVIHNDRCKYESGLLPNRILCESNAMVKLTAKCGFLLTPPFVNLHPCINNAFSRAIIILSDKGFATEIIKKIFNLNSESLEDIRDYDLPLVPFRKLYKVDSPPPFESIFTFRKEQEESCEKVSKELTEDVVSNKYFTGFCVDCVNKILMYIEGPTISTFPKLLTELSKFNVTQGRILYSSDLIYETRIYDAFKRFGGIYCVTMGSTVEDFINKGTSSSYHELSVPEPAWKALKIISKLIASKSVLEAVQENHFPHPEQLISFDIEFGIPHCIVK